MNDQQTAAMVLAKAALFDPSFPKPDPMILAAWAEALAGVDPQSAVDAVSKHYRASSYRIMPADVLRFANEAQPAQPLTSANYNMVPNADPDDVGAWLEALRRKDLVDTSPRPDATARPIGALVESTLARRPVEAEPKSSAPIESRTA